jgi:hypothetical protein
LRTGDAAGEHEQDRDLPGVHRVAPCGPADHARGREAVRPRQCRERSAIDPRGVARDVTYEALAAVRVPRVARRERELVIGERVVARGELISMTRGRASSSTRCRISGGWSTQSPGSSTNGRPASQTTRTRRDSSR